MFQPSSNIERAFYQLYGFGLNEDKYEDFASRWGGLDMETFRRVSRDGHGDDKAIAIFAIGYQGTPQAAEEIAPFLHDPERMARWASALCLGEMKDERALPYLETMLLEGLTVDEYRRAYQDDDTSQAEAVFWCDGVRSQVLSLLDTWDAPSLIPTLRESFKRYWEIEQELSNPPELSHYYYDRLAYGLGKRGALGALTGLDLPPSHRKVATVYLALGYLQVKPQDVAATDLIGRMITDETLHRDVAKILEERFGLMEEERWDIVINFYKYTSARPRYLHGNTSFEEEEEDIDEEEDEEDYERIEPKKPAFLCVYQGHRAPVTSLAWSPDSSRLLSAARDATVHIWDAATGTTLLTLPGPTDSVNVVAWSPDGRYVAAAGNDHQVYVWHAETGALVCTYHGHHALITQGLAWSPNGTRIASGSWDGTAQIWDALTGDPLLIYRGHQAIVYTVAWSPDGTYIVSGSGYPEGLVHIWDARTGERVLIYREHGAEAGQVLEPGAVEPRGVSSVHSLLWLPDGKHIVSAGLHWTCRVWDATSGQDVTAFDHTCGPLALRVDGDTVASPSFGSSGVDVWQASTGRILLKYDAIPTPLADVQTVGWSPDGTRIAAADGRNGTVGTVKIWEVRLP
jgi:WD40 repeat protein